MRSYEIVCDRCGTKFKKSPPSRKLIVESLARDEGWSIGLYDTCPKCVEEKLKEKEEKGRRL